jgi:hydrophobic/amphiphilic exporter-1 (mainly G- bacteria), HAE1 family
VLAEMEKDPRFRQPRLSTDANQPQLFVTVDRERASDLGIDIKGLSPALQAMLDGRKITSVFIEDRCHANSSSARSPSPPALPTTSHSATR